MNAMILAAGQGMHMRSLARHLSQTITTILKGGIVLFAPASASGMKHDFRWIDIGRIGDHGRAVQRSRCLGLPCLRLPGRDEPPEGGVGRAVRVAWETTTLRGPVHLAVSGEDGMYADGRTRLCRMDVILPWSDAPERAPLAC